MTSLLAVRPGQGDPTPDQIAGLRYRPELDGLRAVAVALVIAADLFGQPRGGLVGIDVLFVVSGFIITTLLAGDLRTRPRLGLGHFYLRRIQRLLPGPIVVLGVSALCARLLFSAPRAHTTYRDIEWSAALLGNVHFASLNPVPTPGPLSSPVQQLWWTSVQAQFYLLWPIVFALLSGLAFALWRRRARALLLVGATLLLGGSITLALMRASAHPHGAFFDSRTRLWEPVLGAVVACAVAGHRQLPTMLRQICLPLGLITIGAAAALVRIGTHYPVPLAIAPAAGTALVILGGSGEYLPVSAWPLIQPAARYLGRLSYSLYLWHWPVIVFLPEVVSHQDNYSRTTALLFTAAVSVVSFHFIEEPLRQLQRRPGSRGWRRRRPASAARSGRTGSARGAGGRPFSGRAYGTRGVTAGGGELRAAALAAALLTIASFVVWQARPYDPVHTFVPSTDDTSAAQVGGPQLGELTAPSSVTGAIDEALSATAFPDLTPSLSDAPADHGPEWSSCADVDANTLSDCTFAGASEGLLVHTAKSLAVLGDTTALGWLPAIRAVQGQGYDVYALTSADCPAISVTLGDPERQSACAAHFDWAVAEVHHLKPQVVVLATDPADLAQLSGSAGGATAAWQAATTDTIDRLTAAGAHRVVVLAAPPTVPDWSQCTGTSTDPGKCIGQVSTAWRQVADADRNATSPELAARYVDARSYLCAVNDFCPSFIGTAPVRTDGRHLTATFATSLGPVVSAAVLGTG
ncbi:acyltransferase [Jatrophihabitans telluris]|uniref:Acyltransferase n=1 Tax=Jatrophihabitans telluris TaxID=2038343 RepID=A0ABY4R084_9ACTN|nr:acyltransferase family protein [Jatrophihabitans telluris]UQX89159.1 acyltransferase [Jatrophihabitans telluris]